MTLDISKNQWRSTGGESWKETKVFDQRPGSTEEEDGVLVFVCLGTSQENTTTYFVVLNPDLEELGRFSAPFPTPLGFHGTWV